MAYLYILNQESLAMITMQSACQINVVGKVHVHVRSLLMAIRDFWVGYQVSA